MDRPSHLCCASTQGYYLARGRQAHHAGFWCGCRLQELEAQHRSHQVEQEAAEFEKLQMKFGFSDKVSTACRHCRIAMGALSWV